MTDDSPTDLPFWSKETQRRSDALEAAEQRGDPEEDLTRLRDRLAEADRELKAAMRMPPASA